VHRVRALGKEWRGRLHAIHLQKTILFGHFIPATAIYQAGRPLVGKMHWQVLRIGFWRLRAAALIIRSYKFAPARLHLLRMRLFGHTDRFGNRYLGRWR
jgi:hypothetical protein